MARALKVFSTPAGFFNAVVAAPSQKAALDAWGVRENLFATGAAKVVDDADLIRRALAQPGEIVRVPISSDAGFVAAAKPPPRAGSTPSPAAKAVTKPPKPRPDRSNLTHAEDALRALERSHHATLDALQSERAALDAREADERRAFASALKAAQAEVVIAQHAYDAAAG